MYLVALVWAGVLLRQQFAVRMHVLAFAADLALVQTWSLRMVSFFNVPAWSVSSEAFFYAVFPFAVLRLRPSSRGRALWSVAGWWLLALVPPAVCLVVAPQGAWHEGEGMWAFWVRRSPLLALPEFLAGIALGWLLVRFRPEAKVLAWLGGIGAAGALLGLYFADRLPALMLHNGLLLPFYAMVLLGLSGENWLACLLAWRPLVVLGEASYSLYLTHFLLNDWMQRRWGVGSGFGALGWKLAWAIGLALALHGVVERPCRRWILRWWGAREAGRLQASR